MKQFFQIIFPIFFVAIIGGCMNDSKESELFQLLDPKHTNINFKNIINETEDFNMYTFLNLYTGGGVAVGDINNDGLDDLFFSGNRITSKLYLNKGNLEFEDITEKSGMITDRWCAGASMIDINSDGHLDIYISVSGVGSALQKSNLLFENNGDLTFSEKAQEYGLADSTQCMHTSFFDYDKDGDLDAYIIINPVNYTLSNVNLVKPKIVDGSAASTDKLYRNDNGKFIDVSNAAGINIEGYSLGVATADVNGDRWPDIYVSNDFLTNDILYINNQDGTFTNQAASKLKHTSFAGMGNDVVDINNDGNNDIFVVDMLPEDNLRRQTIIPSSSYDKFALTQVEGYEAQYTRNTLQINNGDGSFSEIGQLSGIDKTDWSWSSLFADYDNDGDKDLLVTNGFLRDVGNLDYINYQRKNNANPFGKKEIAHKKRLEAIQNLGAAKIKNYIFENAGGLKFEKKTDEWGLSQKTCSNGAAFSDLDNDGDLDLVINNVNDFASVYENKTNLNSNNNYLKVELNGSEFNPNGIGAQIRIRTKNGRQFYYHNLYRGYASTITNSIHFGLGEEEVVKNMSILWPNGNIQNLKDVKANQILSVDIKDAGTRNSKEKKSKSVFFEDVSNKSGLIYQHKENSFIDFKVQPLLPHKHSQNGPGMAVGDVNGDGLDDIYFGGARGSDGQLFFQNKKSEFTKSEQSFDLTFEDMGCLFFDADNDQDLDLYIVSGGSSFLKSTEKFQDRLYVNDGNGIFSRIKNSIPNIDASGSTVNAADFDQDGDLDLFVGGRVVAGEYPMPAKSYILRNDSESGLVKFTDVTKEHLSNDGKIGLVTSALWTDYNNDGWVDLMVTGEWMPITFFPNKNGKLNAKKPIEIDHSNGWWNSLTAGDFDQDGDIDYMAGNLGLNSRYKASLEKPLCIYANDYDKNGRIDPVMCQYIGDRNHIVHPRDLLIQQINAMRVRFKSYEEYGERDFEDSFTKEELDDAYVVKSTTFESSYIENLGNGKFALKGLPAKMQMGPIYGLQVLDINHDGNLDVMAVGNSYATEVAIGRYDALRGVVLRGDGEGNFNFVENQKTGFIAESDAKGLVNLLDANNQSILVVSKNNDTSQAYEAIGPGKVKTIRLSADDQYAYLVFKNGNRVKQEFFHGSGYLSQSSRVLNIPVAVESAEIYTSKGEKRTIDLANI